MSQKKQQTRQEYVAERWPNVEPGTKLFNQLVALQDFNPLFKYKVRVYDHLDWLDEKQKRQSIATQIRINGGKTKKNIYGGA